MSQLTNTAQSSTTGAKLVDAGLAPDTDEFAAASAMVRSGASIDDAVTKYGGSNLPTSAIATQQPSAPAVVQKKRQRGGIAPVDLSVGKADASGDLAGAHKAGMDVGYTAVDPLMQQYENGVQAGVTKAVEDSRLRVQGFLGGALGRLDASFCDISGVDS
jgi:hypothetical protein